MLCCESPTSSPLRTVFPSCLPHGEGRHVHMKSKGNNSYIPYSPYYSWWTLTQILLDMSPFLDPQKNASYISFTWIITSPLILLIYSICRSWICPWFLRTTHHRKKSTQTMSSVATCGTARSSKRKKRRKKTPSGSDNTVSTLHRMHTFTLINTPIHPCFILYIFRYFILDVNKEPITFQNAFHVMDDFLTAMCARVHPPIQIPGTLHDAEGRRRSIHRSFHWWGTLQDGPRKFTSYGNRHWLVVTIPAMHHRLEKIVTHIDRMKKENMLKRRGCHGRRIDRLFSSALHTAPWCRLDQYVALHTIHCRVFLSISVPIFDWDVELIPLTASMKTNDPTWKVYLKKKTIRRNAVHHKEAVQIFIIYHF